MIGQIESYSTDSRDERRHGCGQHGRVWTAPHNAQQLRDQSTCLPFRYTPDRSGYYGRIGERCVSIRMFWISSMPTHDTSRVELLTRPPYLMFRPLPSLRFEVFELLDERQRPEA